MTTASSFSYEHSAGFTFPRPEGWDRIEADDGMIVVAHPPVPEGVFRPNLVLRWAPANGISLARYATAALAGTLQTAQQVRILAHEAWPVNGPQGPVAGRRQRFVHQVEQHPVCVDRWLWIAGGHVLEATASYTVDQHAWMKLLFVQMIREIRVVDAHPDAKSEQAPGNLIDAIAPTEPRLDEAASRLAGEDREDLGSLAAAQTYRESAYRLSIPSLELIDTLAGRNKLGMFQRKGPEFVGLRDAGLLAADGSLTAAGMEFLAPVRTPDASFTVQAADAGGGSVLQAWIGGGYGRVTAEPSRFSGAPVSIPRPDDLAVQLLQANAVPKAIADWLGFTPAWSIAHEPVILTLEHYDARLASAQIKAPEGLDDASLRMWEQPWTEWQIIDEGTGGWFGFLNAGAAGQYRLGTVNDDSIILKPITSAAVWDVLVRFIHASVEGIPLMLPEVQGFDEAPANGGGAPRGRKWVGNPSR